MFIDVKDIMCILMSFWRGFYTSIVDYLMPPSCLSCRSLVWGKGLCSRCWQKCTFILDLHCTKCGRLARYQGLLCGICIKEPPEYHQAHSLIDFNASSKRLIHDLKYRDRTDLINFFAKLLYAHYRDFILGVDLIIPVPMHFLRRLIRFYNHANLLALALSVHSNKPIEPFILCKSRFTRTQTTMNKKERKQNLQHSFAILKSDLIKGKNVLLVDDVMTTGSTVNLCAKAIKDAGASSVRVLTIASVR